MAGFDSQSLACNKLCHFMRKPDNDPPLLTGFSTKGKALTSPVTSLWLAIIFAALFFALMSVRRNISRIEEAENPPNLMFSPYLSEAPEKKAQSPGSARKGSVCRVR